MLEFEIQDQIMTRMDDSVVIARSEALKAHFEFKTDQWQPPYFAVFQGMKTDPYTVCLDWENNCIVPWEAIRYSGAMEVSLYSIPAYPTNRVKVKILDTGFDGCFPLPSPNIYDQLLFNKADEIDVEDGDVLLRAFGKEISRAKLPTGAGGGGEPGKAATIQVGQVTTGEPGSEAQVTNSGSENAAVFDFVIPRGEPGPKGDTGAAGPQGERGEQGPAGADGAQGLQGNPGQAATIQVGEVTTGEPGSEAQVTNSGSENAAVFDFVIPRGEPGAAGPQGERGEQGPAGSDGASGPQGDPGQAATIQVGQVTTGEPGSEAQVTNSGSESAAVFDFVIPRGEPGAAGPQGERGEQGPAGQGIPAGGSAGQIPSKVDGSDYNLHWITPPGVYIESYVGNDESERTINLKVTPKCVFVFGENTALTMNDMTTPSINLCYSGAAAQGKGSLGLSLDGNMLKVNNDPDLSMAQTRRKLNSFGVNYIVLAWN